MSRPCSSFRLRILNHSRSDVDIRILALLRTTKGKYVPVEEGIFHDDGIRANEIKLLRDFASKYNAETADDGCSRIRVYSRSKFVAEVLGLAIQAGAFIVCFNSGFRSQPNRRRLGKCKNGGWSLILSKWRNPRTGALKPNKFFPRIVVKALNSKTSIIHSTRAPMSSGVGKQRM